MNFELDNYIQLILTQNRIPGLSIAIVREGQPILVRGYGLANVEHSVPATKHTVYEIASIGKTFTATITMMLVQEGKISLNDAIADYLDNPPDAWYPVTIAHILSHQSGIPDYTQAETYWNLALSRLDISKSEILALVSHLPLKFQPGEFYAYDNTGFYLLGLMLEKVTGQSYEELLCDRIFAPLGMNATFIHHPRDIVLHRASGYRYKNEKLVNKPYYNPIVTYSGGGLLASVEDMVKWEEALYNGTLLDKATLELMWTPVHSSRGDEWEKQKHLAGLGWQIINYDNRRVVGHNGSILGFASNITRFIDDKITVILLCNLDAIARPDAIAKEIVGYFCRGIAQLELKPAIQ